MRKARHRGTSNHLARRCQQTNDPLPRFSDQAVAYLEDFDRRAAEQNDTHKQVKRASEKMRSSWGRDSLFHSYASKASTGNRRRAPPYWKRVRDVQNFLAADAASPCGSRPQWRTSEISTIRRPARGRICRSRNGLSPTRWDPRLPMLVSVRRAGSIASLRSRRPRLARGSRFRTLARLQQGLVPRRTIEQ